MIGGYRARVAPFNVSYRYVEDELVYLLTDSTARGAGLPRGVRAAGRGDPRPAARTSRCSSRSPTSPATPCCPAPSTTRPSLAHARARQPGMPDTVGRRPLHPLHRRHHRHAQGRAVAPARHLPVVDGRAPVRQRPAAWRPTTSSPSKARASAGAMSMLMIPPFMHGAAQWAAFNAVTMGGRARDPRRRRAAAARRRPAPRRTRTGAEHAGGRRRDRPSAARRDRGRRLRPVRPVHHHQRRRPAVADGARRASSRRCRT